MNKKSLLLTAVLSIITIAGWGQNDLKTGLSFSTNGENATITGFGTHANTGALAIPASVNDGKGGNYIVTALGDWAFQESAITSVSFPNSLTTIGMGSFKMCNGLTSVTLPSSVTTVTSWAFQNSNNLKTVNIQGAASIGDNAFIACPALTTVTMPNATSIGMNSFTACSALTTITMPNATSIGGWAFQDCTSLATITMTNATSIGEWAFQNCTSLPAITIPNGVTTINGGTFSGCSGLTSIVIPNSVTTIADWSIEKTGLTSLTIPSSVTSIGYGAFNTCTNLVTVTYDSPAVTTNNVFMNCTSLATMNMTNSTGGTALTSLDRTSEASFFGGLPTTAVITLPANTPAEGAAYDALVATLNGTPLSNYVFPIPAGINDITVTGNAPTAIYTTDGKFVGTDINTLPKGLYIVNGKKVIK